MAEKVLPAINKDRLHNGKVRFDDHEMNGVDVKALLDAVRTSKDGEYVTIQGNDSDVRVAKQGGYMFVHVTEKHSYTDKNGKPSEKSRVEVKIPMKVVDALFSAGKDELDIVAALRALSAHGGDTELVSVKSDENTVRVWLDSKNISDQAANRRRKSARKRARRGALNDSKRRCRTTCGQRARNLVQQNIPLVHESKKNTEANASLFFTSCSVFRISYFDYFGFTLPSPAESKSPQTSSSSAIPPAAKSLSRFRPCSDARKGTQSYPAASIPTNPCTCESGHPHARFRRATGRPPTDGSPSSRISAMEPLPHTFPSRRDTRIPRTGFHLVGSRACDFPASANRRTSSPYKVFWRSSQMEQDQSPSQATGDSPFRCVNRE